MSSKTPTARTRKPTHKPSQTHVLAQVSSEACLWATCRTSLLPAACKTGCTAPSSSTTSVHGRSISSRWKSKRKQVRLVNFDVEAILSNKCHVIRPTSPALQWKPRWPRCCSRTFIKPKGKGEANPQMTGKWKRGLPSYHPNPDFFACILCEFQNVEPDASR